MASREKVTSAFAPDLDEVRAWLQKMIAALRFVEMVTAVIGLIARMRDINTELVAQLAHLRRRHPRSWEALDRTERGSSCYPSEASPCRMPRSPRTTPLRTTTRRSVAGATPGAARHHRTCNACSVFNRVSLPSCASACSVARMMTRHQPFEPPRTQRHPRACLRRRATRRDDRLAPTTTSIVSRPPLPQIVERGKLADTLIVEAVCDKYIEHLPIERQCARFTRAGVDVAPQTLGRSVSAALDLLAPVARLIQEQTRGPGLLGTDATGIPVLDPNATEGIRNGTMWAWTNARWVTLFYSPVGDAESVKRFLGADLARTVQCDGTSIMTFLERTGGKRPGCFAHARRRLVEAARAGDRVALEGVRIIARLFAVERDSTCSGDNAEQRCERRKQFSRPILDELRSWVNRQKAVVPPKTPLGQGLGYLDRQWRRLLLFLEDGNIEATNNRRERELRRLA